MTPDELAAIEWRASDIDSTNPAAARVAHDDVPALIAALRAARAEVATLRREALLRDAGITTTSTEDGA